MNKIILIAFVMSNLVSCQEKTNNKTIYEKGFVIQDTLLYYNQKPLAFGDPIEKFVAAMGKYDREVIDSSGGNINKSWDWKKSGYEAYVDDNNKIKVFNVNINDASIEKEYNTIEEVIKKIGKFDSYKEDKQPVDISKTLVWDKLGVILGVNEKNNTISGIVIQTIHPKKTFDPNDSPESNSSLLSKNDPKEEYKGSFTYNGNTVNFKELDYNSWDKVVAGLKIAGDDFDPPGDSKSWSREIRESFNSMMVYIYRISNQYDGRDVKPKFGYDCVKHITMGTFPDNDEK
jgi:hypothetical protein